MTAGEPLSLAARALHAALGLYGRHIVLLTGVSLVPALARVGLFLEVPWMAGPLSGAIELIVGGFRFLLLLASFRLVWPQGLAGIQEGKMRWAHLSQVSWPELVWQVLLLALVPLVLNSVAGLLANLVATDPRGQTAALFALKNLFIIPFWMVHLLVAIRTTLQG